MIRKKNVKFDPPIEVPAYIAACHTYYNYDIDPLISGSTATYLHKYVVPQVYSYTVLDQKDLTFSHIRYGKIYRSRLIGVVSGESKYQDSLSKTLTSICSKKICATNRWVMCFIKEIDTYGRLLIDIQIDNDMSLSSFLIKEAKLRGRQLALSYTKF